MAMTGRCEDGASACAPVDALEYAERARRRNDFLHGRAVRAGQIIELLDHHRLPVQRWTRRIGAGTTQFHFDPKLEGGIPILRFQVGRWTGYTELQGMDGCYFNPPE